jgi:hypothetical protein
LNAPRFRAIFLTVRSLQRTDPFISSHPPRHSC